MTKIVPASRYRLRATFSSRYFPSGHYREQGQIAVVIQQEAKEKAVQQRAEVTQETNDKKQLLSMIAQIETNLEQKPEKVSADMGYFSEANVTDQSVKEADLYVEAVPS
jgi:hypothetical protein